MLVVKLFHEIVANIIFVCGASKKMKNIRRNFHMAFFSFELVKSKIKKIN